MKIYYELDLKSFPAWSGAVDTLNTLTYNQINLLEDMLPDILGDEVSETRLNDFLWFEDDCIAELLGFEDWEALEHTNNGDRKVWNVYKISSGGVKKLLQSFDEEGNAYDFCVEQEWEYTDENEFVWELDYESEWEEN